MRRWVLLAGCTAIALAFSGTAHAASCTYDQTTRTVTLALDRYGSDSLYVGGRGTIESSLLGTCGGATIRNTDLILVRGAVDGSEDFAISEQGGPFARETGPRRSRGEIKIDIDLAGWDTSFFTHDTLRITAGDGDDTLVIGAAGLDMNGDGDLDVAVANNPELTVEGAGGSDSISAQGGGATGGQYAGTFTLHLWGATEFAYQGAIGEANTLIGRDGRDLIQAAGTLGNLIVGHGGDDGLFGWWGDDTISGGAGADSIFGDDGIDSISGGADGDSIHGNSGADSIAGDDGADSIEGGFGRDTIDGGAGNDDIRADDREPDVVDGGADQDRAFVDSFDTVTNVEEVFVF